ncbi:MAG: hypothetical protein ACI8ZB_003131 [Desulforhopalus sp.]|jgi:hypothetical protein
MRNKPYYGLKTVKQLVSNKRVVINQNARRTALKDFGWKQLDIQKSLLKLQPKHFYKSDYKYDDPSIYVDYYKAYGLMGEDVYIHFRIEDNYLIICSFKEV